MDLRKFKLKTATVSTARAGDVNIRELDAPSLVEVMGTHTSLDGGSTDNEKAAELYYMLIARSVTNGDDRPYLTTDDVRSMPWDLVVELGVECLRLNNMLDEKKTN